VIRLTVTSAARWQCGKPAVLSAANRVVRVTGTAGRSVLQVRLATSADLRYAVRDSGLPEPLVTRKIRWQEVIIAVDRTTRVGCLHVDYLWSRVPYVSLLLAGPQPGDSTVARALLTRTERFLRGRGYDLLLSSSRIGIEPRRLWHRQLGFEVIGVIAGLGPAGEHETFFLKELRPTARRVTALAYKGSHYSYERSPYPDAEGRHSRQLEAQPPAVGLTRF
jgi:hypothetical protein